MDRGGAPQGVREKVARVEVGDEVGGAGQERTLRANESDYDRFVLRPRLLSGLSNPDLNIDVLGSRWAAPIGIAPMAYHTMVHEDGEAGTARGAAVRGLPLIISTFAGRSFADIAAVTASPLWL